MHKVHSQCFVIHDEHFTFLLVKHHSVHSTNLYASLTYHVMVDSMIMLFVLLLIAPNMHCILTMLLSL